MHRVRPLALAASLSVLPASALLAQDAAEVSDLATLAERILADDFSENGEVLIDAVLAEDDGGLEAIRARGFMRMAVAPDPLMIAFDGEDAIGVAISISRELERYLAELPDAPPAPTVVVPTPSPRSEIAERIADGQSDFTTMTVDRAEDLDALEPTTDLITEINDVPVLGPGLDRIETMDDLATVPIYLQDGGRYARNLLELNADREAAGDTPLDLRFVDGRLDDYDLIEMVQVGLIPATVASDFKARFWQTVYEDVTIREDLPLTEDARIAWVVRAKNPELQGVIDGFAQTMKKGTLLGNIMLNEYLSSADWIQNINTDTARIRIDNVEPVITQYSEQYGFEPLLVLAQAYQESGLDQNARSHVGAVGVMQVMPATAADPVVGIPDISDVERNVEAGVKYLRWLRDTFFDDPEMDPLDQTLLAFAAYNAGPGGVRRAQKRAADMGLNPNVWFENVEVAIQKAVSREPAIYVRNIFKYYVSYRLLAELEAEAGEVRVNLDDLPDNIEQLSFEEREQILEEQTGGILVEQ